LKKKSSTLFQQTTDTIDTGNNELHGNDVRGPTYFSSKETGHAWSIELISETLDSWALSFVSAYPFDKHPMFLYSFQIHLLAALVISY